MLHSWMSRFADIRPDEIRATLWSFLYFFCLLAGYYVLRPLRDEMGIVAIVPHVTHLEHMISPRPYSYWLKIDFEILEHCHALYRIPGESSGADQEELFAEQHGIPVIRTLPELAEFVTAWRLT